MPSPGRSGVPSPGESLVCLPWRGGSGVPSPCALPRGESGVLPLEGRVWSDFLHLVSSSYGEVAMG